MQANTSETHAKVQIFQRLMRASVIVTGWLTDSNRKSVDYVTLSDDIRKTACKLAKQGDVKGSWKQVVETLDLAAYRTPGQSQENMVEKLNKELRESVVILGNSGLECSPLRSSRHKSILRDPIPVPQHSSNCKQ